MIMKPPLLLLAITALLAVSTVSALCDDIVCAAVVIPLPKECSLRTTQQIPEDVCTCAWDKCSCGYSCHFPQCDAFNTTVTCPGEPCQAKNCQYGCTNDYCTGCAGLCWEKPYTPTNTTTTSPTTPPCDGVCPAVVVPLPSGCQVRNENATAECLCDWDQCFCRWQCSIPAVPPCPNPVQCLIDPCSTTTCDTGKVCKSSYCGACTATCVPIADGPTSPTNTTTSSPTTTTPPCDGVCPAVVVPLPDGCQVRNENSTSECLCEWDQCFCRWQCSIPAVPPCPNPVQCLIDPCSTTTCRTGTVCRSSYCGACTATCVPIEQGPTDPNVSSNCPNPVQCLVDPCASMSCITGTVCEQNYCYGCNATCKPIATEKPPMNCDGVKCVDPCIAMTCVTGNICVKTDCCHATCTPPTSPTNGNDTSKCYYNGTIYTLGDSIQMPDGCNTCICLSIGMYCTKYTFDGPICPNGCKCTVHGPMCAICLKNDTCTYHGTNYTQGQSTTSIDGCNTCTCQMMNNGKLDMACTERACSSTSGVSNGTCIYNGQTYTPGQSTKSTDGCNTCTCTNQGMACTLMACSSTGNNNNVTCTANGRTYTPGQNMISLDGCNTCTCGQDGRIECTLMGCLNNTATYVGVTPTVLLATTVALAMIV